MRKINHPGHLLGNKNGFWEKITVKPILFIEDVLSFLGGWGWGCGGQSKEEEEQLQGLEGQLAAVAGTCNRSVSEVRRQGREGAAEAGQEHLSGTQKTFELP